MTFVYFLAAIFVFGVLVAVHEFGHFMAAKLCGVRVNEFSVGMGPAIWSWERGETQYSLRALPVGGFCAMEGEDEDSADERALCRQGFWKQFVIFAAGAFMNFLTGLLIVLVLFSEYQGFRVAGVSGGAPDLQTENGETLQNGDLFWSINGERVYVYEDIQMLLELAGKQPLDLVMIRNGEKVTLEGLTWGTRTDQNGEAYSGYGIYLSTELQKATFGVKVKQAWLNTIDFARVVRLSLKMLFTGEAGVEDLTGPVGIVSTITEVGTDAETVGAAVRSIAYFAAMLAVNLSVMNMLPIPALDGGHILLLVIDTVTMALFKKKIPTKYASALTTACFVLLMGFMLLVTFQDVFKLVG